VTAWPSISTATLADRVYGSIRDRVLRGALAPGHYLREVEISKALGVSRTPVREALARLSRDGFVEWQARRGYRVPPEPIGQLLDLYPIVAALEVVAGELAFPSMKAEVITNLRALNEKCRVAVAQGEVKKGIEANHEFHHVLSEGCGNAQLCQLLDALRAQVVRLELWSATDLDQVGEAIKQHDEIVAAIERKDFPTALAILKRNRLQTYHAFHQELGSEPPVPTDG
jgi:DNA-binding GntR family transcriptional regulator